MKRETAMLIVEEVGEELAAACEEWEVAGSVRRLKPEVNDIDFVLIPKEEYEEDMNSILSRFGDLTMAGPKIKRLDYKGEHGQISLDFYIATRETFATLLLIRTGSVQSNIRLCKRAQSMGMKLHASGTGMSDQNGPIKIEAEQDVYSMLGLNYQKPSERE